MEIRIHIPDDIAEDIRKPNGQDIARHVLEAYVIQAYQQRELGTAQLRRLLGFETRYEFEDFLGVTMSRVTTRLPTWNTTVKPPACLASDARCVGEPPVRYLRVLDCAHVLPLLFGHILIPHAVLGELQHPNAPAIVRTWLADPPVWLEVRPIVGRPDAALAMLEAGSKKPLFLLRNSRPISCLSMMARRVTLLSRGTPRHGHGGRARTGSRPGTC